MILENIKKNLYPLLEILFISNYFYRKMEET